MNKKELLDHLNEYLQINEFEDPSKNGLQVDNPRTEIKKIGYAVDANTYIFDRAIQEEVDLMITHHGIFWGGETVVTGLHYERIKKLVKNDIALYGVHLPLDAHPEVGNNKGLLKGLINSLSITPNEEDIEKVAEYQGNTIGYGIRFSEEIPSAGLISPFTEQMGIRSVFHNFGKKQFIKSVAIVSGGGGSTISEIKEKNYDVLITGEAAHFQIAMAKEMGLSILLGGHRETEKIGVKLLAKHLEDNFSLETVFLDEKY